MTFIYLVAIWLEFNLYTRLILGNITQNTHYWDLGEASDDDNLGNACTQWRPIIETAILSSGFSLSALCPALLRNIDLTGIDGARDSNDRFRDVATV